MDYPTEFSAKARARVEAEKLRATRQLELEKAEKPPDDWTRGTHAWDKCAFYLYILRVVKVFAREACELGKVGRWTVERVQANVNEFLRTFTIAAYYKCGQDRFGQEFPNMTSNSDGSLLPEVERLFHDSKEWREYEAELLQVADEQAARPIEPDSGGIGSSHASATNSISHHAADKVELPSRRQDAFEAAKINSELEFAKRAERFPDHPRFADLSLHVFVLIQNVFFAYCAQARNAYREGEWSVAQVSQAIENAWPSICDSYFIREHGSSSEEEKSRFRVALRRTVTDDPKWKQHLSELRALAERPRIEPNNLKEAQPKAENVTGTVAANAARGAEKIESVSTPGGLPQAEDLKARRWEDIEIVFLSEFKVQVSINTKPQQPQNYVEMGFDNKKNDKPIAAWETLWELAQQGGVCRVAADSRKWGRIEKRIQEIRKAFRRRFDLADDPIPFIKKSPRNLQDFGYRAKFKIRCHPASEA